MSRGQWGALALLVVTGCGRPVLEAPTGEPAPTAAWFVDVATERGVDFHHEDGRSGEYYYPETAASGAGWLDFDGDGDLDLYLVNGAETPGRELAAAPRNALYENRDGRFVEVAAAAGVDDGRYGMGLCVGDADGDGLLDLMVTNFGPDRLYRNRGDGTFEDVAPAAGVDDPRWSSSCAFGDVDADGDLDLWVTHYVDFDFQRNPWCGDRARDLRSYCRPSTFDGVPDSLFVNRGDGTFVDEGAARGLVQGPLEKGFGVALVDLDGDGDLDAYVANDGTPNRLYVNDGRGSFDDRALAAGCAVDGSGVAESSMGLEVGDVDGDGRFDLVVTNYSMETDTLFLNRGGLIFDDASDALGVAAPTLRHMSWGVGLFDADNDGDLDLGLARGHTMDNIAEFEAGMLYRQPDALLVNLGAGRFAEVGAEAGPAWSAPEVSRGLAVGDLDDDGRLDVVIMATNGRPRLLANRHPDPGHWLGVRLVGPPGNRQAIGATAVLRLPGRELHRLVRSGGSFQSQHDLRLHFGLGAETGPVELEVRWPDGTRQRERITGVDRYVEVRWGGAG